MEICETTCCLMDKAADQSYQGAPIDLFPAADNPTVGADPTKNNGEHALY
jgi:hypothetical protein